MVTITFHDNTTDTYVNVWSTSAKDGLFTILLVNNGATYKHSFPIDNIKKIQEETRGQIGYGLEER